MCENVVKVVKRLNNSKIIARDLSQIFLVIKIIFRTIKTNFRATKSFLKDLMDLLNGIFVFVK
jgi:hypothetical protein